MSFRSPNSVLDDEDDRTELGSDEAIDVARQLEGEHLEFTHDAPLRKGETDEVKVLEVTAVEVTVRNTESDVEWSMGWDRTLDRTDAADRCEELATRREGGES